MMHSIPYLGYVNVDTISGVWYRSARVRYKYRYPDGHRKAGRAKGHVDVAWPFRLKAFKQYEMFETPERRIATVYVRFVGKEWPTEIECRSTDHAIQVRDEILGALAAAKAADQDPIERIVAAAVDITMFDPAKPEFADPPRAYTVSLPRPARHHHIIHAVSESLGRPIVPHEQGFLTSTGRFVGRKEAYGIALRAGQAKPKPGTLLPDLFSEDLW